jgi:protein-arginine deiminase
VGEVLADPDVMAASQEAQLHVDEIVALLASETGKTAAEVVPFPFLFTAWNGRLTAYQPGTVNLLPAGRTLIVPRPFGPVVDGADVFEVDLERRLAALDLTPVFVDDWYVYHVNLGEVHCGTNAIRDIDVRFWEEIP